MKNSGGVGRSIAKVVSFAGVLVAGTAGAADMRVKAVAPVAEAPSWISSVTTDFQYYSWRSNRGFPTFNDPVFGNPGRGWQVYIPTSYSLTGLVANDLKLEFTARTGLVSSEQRTPGEQGKYSGPTDSQLSATLTYSGFNGIQPYLSVLTNLPTGQSRLLGPDRFARMDPDLVGLSSFGEGFNVGPTFGVNIPLNENLLASLSGGYTYRGPFNREGLIDFVTLEQPTLRAQPGDSATVTGSLGYNQGAFQLQGSVSYSWDQASRLDGVTQFRPGERATVTVSGAYAWTDQWRTSVNAFYTHSERNAFPNAVQVLVVEPSNSNSNVFRISSETTYTFVNNFAIGPAVSYLDRDRNGYDPFTFTFVPAKTRVGAGGLASYGVGNFSLNGRAERIWTRENESPGTGLPIITADGWFASLGATVRF